MMAKTATEKSRLYSVHPGVTMVQKWITELKTEDGTLMGRVAQADPERRSGGRAGTARMAEDETRSGH